MEILVEKYMKPPRTGLEAFEQMPEETLCQLINDAIVMSPAPTPYHQQVVDDVFAQLRSYVKERKLGKLFFSTN